MSVIGQLEMSGFSVVYNRTQIFLSQYSTLTDSMISELTIKSSRVYFL